VRDKIYLIQNKNFKKLIFLIPIIISLIIFLIRVFIIDWHQTYSIIIREDGPIEYSTLIVYLIAFIVSITILKFFKKDKKFFVLYLVFSIGFFLIAMEEISWGQRIFDFNTPNWFPENRQNETNLHNLESLLQFRHASMMSVSIFGTFSWLAIPKIQKKFSVFSKTTYKKILRVVIPSKFLMGYFFPVFIVFFIYDISSSTIFNFEYRSNFILYETEPFELLLGIGILLFLLNSYRKQKNLENS
jgi:hypothetical protein